MKISSPVVPVSSPYAPTASTRPFPSSEKVFFVSAPVAMVVEFYEFPDERSVFFKAAFAFSVRVGATPARVRPFPSTTIPLGFSVGASPVRAAYGATTFNSTDNSSLISLF